MQENVLVEPKSEAEIRTEVMAKLQSHLEPIQYDATRLQFENSETKVQLVEAEYCKVTAHVQTSKEKIKEKINEASKWFASAKIPGFRKNKAPLNAIKMQFRKQIEQIATEALMEDAIEEVEYQTHLEYLGRPTVMGGQLHDNTFWCDLMFLKKPEVKINQCKGFQLTKLNTTVDELVEKKLLELQKKHSKVSEVTSQPVKDDILTLSVKISTDLEGEKVISTENIQHQLGSWEYQVDSGVSCIGGFDEMLVDMTMGYIKKFELIGDATLPEEYFGQTLYFTVKLFSAVRVELPELNNELVKKDFISTKSQDELVLHQIYEAVQDEPINISLANLKEEYRLQAETELKTLEFQHLANQLIQKLLELNGEIKVPDFLIQNKAMEIAKALDKQGDTKIWNSLKTRNDVLQQAEIQWKLALILDAVRKEEPESVFSDQEIMNYLKRQNQLKDGDKIVKGKSVGNMSSEIDKLAIQKERESILKNNPQLPMLLEKMKNDATIQWMLDRCEVA